MPQTKGTGSIKDKEMEKGLAKLDSKELRVRLLQLGVDMPSSVSRDFMIKKILAKEKEKLDQGGTLLGQSVSPGVGGSGSLRRSRSTGRGTTRQSASTMDNTRNGTITMPGTTRRSIAIPTSTRTSSSITEVNPTPQMMEVRARKSLSGSGSAVSSKSVMEGNPTSQMMDVRGTARKSLMRSAPSPPKSGFGVSFASRGGRTSSKRRASSSPESNDEYDEPVRQGGSQYHTGTSEGREMAMDVDGLPRKILKTSSPVKPKKSRPSDHSSARQPYWEFFGPRRNTPTPERKSTATTATLNTTLSPQSVMTCRSMFSVIAGSRRVQTECIPNQNIEPTKFIFEIAEAEGVEYITVFLNEGETFAAGTGAKVFFGWPDAQNEIKWHDIGNLSNMKPSAIFNVSSIKQVARTNRLSLGLGSFFAGGGSQTSDLPVTAQVGVSFENLADMKPSSFPVVQIV